MKKIAYGCFALICAATLIIVLLAFFSGLRENKLKDLPPITRNELDDLAKILQPPPKADEPPAPQTQPGVSKPDSSRSVEAKPDSSRRSEAKPEAKPLSAPATQEQRRQMFARQNKLERLAASAGASPLGSLADIAFLLAGKPEGALFERGEVHIAAGNWEKARNAFTQYLRTSDVYTMRQRACAYLAWLEPDPQLAARYMEIACADNDPLATYRCALLAQATGSTELAQYYLSKTGMNISLTDLKFPNESNGPFTLHTHPPTPKQK